MSQTELPIESLPAWSLLNGISFHDVEISNTEDKGFGLVTRKLLSQAPETEADEVSSGLNLLTVPAELILNARAVDHYSKEDKRFKELLDVAGRQSHRGDILLFLLAQIVINWRDDAHGGGVSNPWTEYVKYLPRVVPLPTLWSETERALLKGTSIEAAVDAKLLALENEFNDLREKSSSVSHWNEAFWEKQTVSFRDWVLLDAWFRSRCMELPRGGSSMVPCVDMVNHSASPTASYAQNDEDGVDLCLNPGTNLASGEEVTISYGATKAAAEMLFSYGFVDLEGVGEKLVLPLEGLSDDPLAQAKVHVFGETPTVRISREEGGTVQWCSPFAYLMSLNEEDGLGIRLMQLTDGSRQIRLFWQDEDATESVRALEGLIQDHPLFKVFQLRAVLIVQERLGTQLERISSEGPTAELLAGQGHGADAVRPSCREAASRLRNAEKRLLQASIDSLEAEKSQLLADETVLGYLGSMEVSQNDLVEEQAANEDDDFS